MQIHATNILGLGATQVVKSFLDAASEKDCLNLSTIYLPSNGLLANYHPKTGNVIRYKRKLLNGISRFLECIFAKFIFPNKPTIVLGDIPLRGITNQIVLVHQPNLIYPKINSYSSKSLNFRVSRFLFSINHKYAKKIIVQTGAMAKDMIKSYPKVKDRIIISPQPVPNWLIKENILRPKVNGRKKKILFYPAAFYPHKKHDFFISLNNYITENKISIEDFEIWITIKDNDFKPLKSIKFLKNLGTLSPSEMNFHYQKADALLFISSMESYGLPLIEALSIKLPILTVDFSYARWILEQEAYYFEPYSEESFIKTLSILKKDLSLNITPDYKKISNKFPNNWGEVVSLYLSALK